MEENYKLKSLKLVRGNKQTLASNSGKKRWWAQTIRKWHIKYIGNSNFQKTFAGKSG